MEVQKQPSCQSLYVLDRLGLAPPIALKLVQLGALPGPRNRPAVLEVRSFEVYVVFSRYYLLDASDMIWIK